MFRPRSSVIGLYALFLIAIAPAWAQNKTTANVPVIVAEVALVQFADELEALGTLIANEGVDITSPVTEVITGIYFEDNQRVKRGDVLVKLDSSEEKAELAEQKVLVRNAHEQVERLSPLIKQGVASVSDYDEALRALDAAKARQTAIESRINQRIISAPFDGVLGLRNISVGGLVQPGDMITSIDDDSVMKLDITVPELFLSSLIAGVEIEARTLALPGKVFRGEIASVDSRIDPITRSIRARAFIANNKALLKPGLLMTVDLQKNPRQGLLIPEEAIVSDGPDHFVFVIKKNADELQAMQTKIELGSRQLGKAEVVRGLSAGDQIVTHGLIRIRDGSKVAISSIESDELSTTELIKANPNREPKG